MALGLSPAEIVAKGEHQLLDKAEHWERVFLSDIAHVQNGFAFKSAFFDRENGTPLIRIRDISNSETEHRYTGEYDDQYVVDHGEILIGMDGDFVASRWKSDKALLNQRVCKLTVESKNIDERFFFLCLQPFLNAINAETSSVTVKHLSSKTIEAIPLPLPPYNEQRRIVAKIEELFSELDKGIEYLKTAREQLTVYRQAVLKHAFEGKLTEQWRNTHSATAWTQTTLGDQLSFLTSGSRGWAKFYAEQGDKFIRAQNLKYDRLDLDDIAFVKLPKKSEGMRTRIQQGDLLVTITGANVTKTAFVKSDIGTAYVSQHVALARPEEGIITEFLYWFLIAEAAGRKQLNASAYGAGKPGLNLENIRSVQISLPRLDEQAEIVTHINSMLSIEESVSVHLDTELRKSEILRLSILKKAFSGQLVEQGPNDEPASVLLERIKAEKTEQGKNNTKKNKKRKDAA